MSGGLDRREAVARLLAQRGDALVVTGLGNPTWDVAAAGDDDRNFYLWGGMGGAAMTGLGIALAQPDRSVVVITGDGEMLMALGALATIGVAQPPNLSVFVLDNSGYAETGSQDSHTAGPVSLTAVAEGCGIGNCETLTAMAQIDAAAKTLAAPQGAPRFSVIDIASGHQPAAYPSRDGAWIARRFRAALGLANG